MLKQSLIVKTNAKANENQIKIIDDIRITYLTSRLIRVESGGNFIDLASKTVFNRCFEVGKFEVQKNGKSIIVETDDIVFVIEKSVPYSACFNDTQRVEIFTHQKNLKGTRRTLDNTYGPAGLDDGLITENGAYLLDDSKTMLIDNEGHFVKRKGSTKDYYAFAYGKNYRETINAFYKISGSVPLVPRFALGVWWSRYHAYTQKEYLDLMARFKAEEIPLTVATIDMDWHWVHNIKDKFGVRYGGWTGYSWNTELFPDYKQFFKQLKDDNLHITLNLHPADGVHSYEDVYEDMAKAVGIDPKTKQKVDFKCGSDDFWNAYFDILHKPYERDGVDFWWIDWQQGKKSDVDGLDPLEALNHYHFLDNAENGNLPLILSRYGGLGSHRYPLGFSGDTAINWRVLNFQPYFTVNSANAAYTWWSHDIGGHMSGYRDDNLYLRWLQFGVFSPIMRLHSTADELLGKEPWKYRADVYLYAKQWLSFRHKLIPYIYSMNYRTHKDGIALCEPMYYSYPDESDAFTVPNQYMFGSELMVCPITTPQSKVNNLGNVSVWLPEGRWTDIVTKQVYNGDKKITMSRELDTIPLLARDGAIIPLSDDEGNKTDNPEKFTILAVSGNGEFKLIEDNNQTDYDEHKAVTSLSMTYDGDTLSFTIGKAEGDISVIPQKRSFRVLVRDAVVDSKELVISFDNINVDEEHTVTVNNVSRITKEETREAVIRIMSRWQQKTTIKLASFKALGNIDSESAIQSRLDNARLPISVRIALEEYFEQI